MGFIPDNVVHTFVVPPGKKIKLSLNVLVPGFEQYIRVIGDSQEFLVTNIPGHTSSFEYTSKTNTSVGSIVEWFFQTGWKGSGDTDTGHFHHNLTQCEFKTDSSFVINVYVTSGVVGNPVYGTIEVSWLD
jgi:hypothetical protein